MPPEPSELRGSAAVEYWNAWISAITNVWTQQNVEWGGLFQHAMDGTFTAGDWMRSMVGSWARWFSLATTFPVEFWTRYRAQLPTVLFVVDRDREYCGAQSVATPVVMSGPGVTVGVTNLVQVGGTETLVNTGPDPFVRAELLEEGTRLEVSLVDLGNQTASARIHNPGLYVGLVYASQQAAGAERIPLAMVQLWAHLTAPSTP